MRIGTMALAASLILFAGAAASASGGATKAAAPDLSGVVKGRQAGMKMSGAIMASIKAALDRGDDVKTLVGPSRTLSGWAASIPGLFPEGSNVAPTEAMPAVWSNPTGFAAQASAFQASLDKMATAAQAGDKAAFTAAFGEARGACSACHSNFKN